MDNRPSRHRPVRIPSSRCEPPIRRWLTGREVGGGRMRVSLITEGGYPYVLGDELLWCDRLVRGLGQHEFDVYALSAGARQEQAGWVRLPGTVRTVHTAPLWTAPETLPAVRHGRRARGRFLECYAELVAAVCAGGGSPGGSGARGAGKRPPGHGGAWWGAQERGVGGRRGASGPSGTGEAVAGGGATGVAEADRFAAAFYALAAFAREEGAPSALLRSEAALRVLEHACRAPGALRPAHAARVGDLLAVAAAMERALRPLSLDWYGASALASADVCHATSGGAAAVPGLLARHFSGVPLLLSEYGGALCARYLARPAASAPVRALLTAFYGRLAAETYRQAACITSPGARVRHWQERCGAARGKLRTVHPGMDATRFTAAGTGVGCEVSVVAGKSGVCGVCGGRGASRASRAFEDSAPCGGCGALGESVPCGGCGASRVPGGSAACGRSVAAGENGTLVWAGSIEPGKDLVVLLHAFAEVHRAEPSARLRIIGAPAPGPEAADYAARCRALAAHLFPDEAADAYGTGENPVSFEVFEAPDAADGAGALTGVAAGGQVDDVAGGQVNGAAGAGWLAEACAAGSVVVLSSVVEGFPVSLLAAMFSGRATVATDVGAVVEVVGGTGLVVPPRNPRALADACLTLLRDTGRRTRLGAAARARALELFSVEQNIRAYGSMYADLAAYCRARRDAPAPPAAPGRSSGRGQAPARRRQAPARRRQALAWGGEAAAWEAPARLVSCPEQAVSGGRAARAGCSTYEEQTTSAVSAVSDISTALVVRAVPVGQAAPVERAAPAARGGAVAREGAR